MSGHVPIKAIVFDLGKVVFDVSFERTFEHWARSMDKSVAEIRNHFRFDDVPDQFEEGKITPEEFRKQIAQRYSIVLPDKQFDEGWCNLYMDAYGEVVPLIRKLKDRYRIAALSNTNEIHARVWPVKYADALSNFEKIFSSHEIGARKPGKEAYAIVLEWLQLPAEEVLFIDDRPENLEGAERMGMRTMLAVSPAQIAADLEKLL